MYRVLICTSNQVELFNRTFVRESRAHEAYLVAKEAQKTYLVDTIATLFEDSVAIHKQEHSWLTCSEQLSPWDDKKVTRSAPSAEQQEKFRRVLEHLQQIQ